MDVLASFASTRFGDDDMSNISLVDGIRVRSASGWWLVRASNTEAALVARAEGTSQSALDGLIADLRETLRQADLTVKI
jgi:phosphomannomutase